MKRIITIAIIMLVANELYAQNIQVTDPPNYPYGININTTFPGSWAREFSISRNGAGKMFSFGVYANDDNLSYGYIGGNTSFGAAYENPWMSFLPNGYIGIGAYPDYKLHIGAGKNDGILIGNYNDRLGWDGTGEQPGYHIRFAGYRDVTANYTGARISALRTNMCCNALATGTELAFYTSGMATGSGDVNLREVMRVTDNFNVAIGTTKASEKLTVDGNIRSRKVIVTQTGWPDYVFEPAYQLPSLDSVHNFIKENKHLPEIPSAATIEKDGHDLGEVQKLLLKKVEELTLYMIEQDKKVKELTQENKKQQNQYEELKTENKELKNQIKTLTIQKL